MIKYWSAVKLLGLAYAKYDPTRVYELEQDESTGTYYMDMYVGTKMEEVHMLIDSQANGTAIQYNQKESKRSIVHHNKRNIVEMPGGRAQGFETTDQLCLDDDEDICLMDFDFLWAEHSFKYPSVHDIEIGGVINFNRYGVDNDEYRSKQLVYDLIDEELFFNSTI